MRKSLVTLLLAMGVVMVPGLGVVGGLAYADEPVRVFYGGSPFADVDAPPSGAWSALLALGFKGRPGDHAEALYVPRKVLVQVCGQHSDSPECSA